MCTTCDARAKQNAPKPRAPLRSLFLRPSSPAPPFLALVCSLAFPKLALALPPPRTYPIFCFLPLGAALAAERDALAACTEGTLHTHTHRRPCLASLSSLCPLPAPLLLGRTCNFAASLLLFQPPFPCALGASLPRLRPFASVDVPATTTNPATAPQDPLASVLSLPTFSVSASLFSFHQPPTSHPPLSPSSFTCSLPQQPPPPLCHLPSLPFATSSFTSALSRAAAAKLFSTHPGLHRGLLPCLPSSLSVHTLCCTRARARARARPRARQGGR